MHSNEMRYFMAVANTGSLSAASKQLFVAVSAISRQIQQLEARLGVPLFERHARGMILNDAGHILENHVRRSITDMELAIAEIEGLKSTRQTTLRVVCTDGLGFNLLPTLLAKYRQQHAAVNFVLTVGSARQVPDLVRNGECDVALKYSLAPEHGVQVFASFSAPFMAVMKEDHPLATTDFQMADLNAFPVALPDQAATIRQLFDLSCRMNGVFIDPVFTCNHFSTLYAFLLNTPDAIAICSHFSVLYSARRDGLQVKSVNMEPLSQRTLQIQTEVSKPTTPALKGFVEFLRDELAIQDARFRQEYGVLG
ncbi:MULTISPECIES: LysR family transcriptional regulator [unclassified Brenneria]|uniref:LysR family transcriptional regulator n=1 Tax=unclassified Brenneria TaxID=2634434 RepID=UPI0015546979|nr:MULTISPECIES: LysR family transcriptional regulator [unclassified Brenneria]MBJ7222244.1 LysR family transcriptional regulator [Brenneria sp. L3-3C-1]MEE3643487.1 LysR family transcriptional regulator [Brenneria sp. L3_3C_1]MEE3651671.1 LysR family transcriptional regulator [Brenneria sp. HEZEL_4_2_4]NPD01628.1 LysR family transcriptional regulator [Brenneria sp. hezel4-2-4]